MDIIQTLAQELDKNPQHVKNVVQLLDEGNTIPFIARYRKELHGAMDDTSLRTLEERLQYLRGLAERRETVKKSISEQGKLTDGLAAAIDSEAMGASTVAMITTAGMMAPLMETMGYTSPLAKVLVVMAIGAGSMVASHANDSYFWVVSQFSDMKTEEAYKCQTGMTAVMGITIIILLFVISLFI